MKKVLKHLPDMLEEDIYGQLVELWKVMCKSKDRKMLKRLSKVE